MNEIKIIQADITDIDTIIAWRMEVLSEVFGADSVNNVGMEELQHANIEYYKKNLPKCSHIACFAIYDNETVGCGSVCFQRELPSPDNPSGRCACLMNIYVRPKFRGRSIGSEIVRWLIQQATDRNTTKIYLETSDSGRKMYEAIGFTDMKDMMIYSKIQK